VGFLSDFSLGSTGQFNDPQATQGRLAGLLGEPGISVLALNPALDRVGPK
jgi:hypothetical protein